MEWLGVIMLLEGKDLSFRYGKGDYVLKDTTISIESGERVGIVAKSGYGKSTLAKIIAGYLKPTKGVVLLDGEQISDKRFYPIQLIYQHPEKAVNPKWKMKDVLEESGAIDNKLIKAIGIEKEWLNRYPRELSGGELQRFCVVRALRDDTKFLIADEITTMLDAITQAQIWQVILEYVSNRDIGMIIVSHNINLAEKICTRIINLEKEKINGR